MDIFVNNSAYRPSPSNGAAEPGYNDRCYALYQGSLLSNKSGRATGSSFYLEPGTGRTVFYNLSVTRHGHADAETGRFNPLAEGDSDAVPGVIGSDRCPAGEPVQTNGDTAGRQ